MEFSLNNYITKGVAYLTDNSINTIKLITNKGR